MPRVDCVRNSAIMRTPRVQQLEGMFDLSPVDRTGEKWGIDVPIEDQPWQIGMIVGPSGCGKTTVAREMFGIEFDEPLRWSKDRTVIDDFPKTMSIKEIVASLSSIGFSSPPNWLRPFAVLSNGEKFRVDVARRLSEEISPITVIDEFTSVVDRRVAQIGCAAVQRKIRSTNRQFVAVSCHYDIVEWLQPDWLLDVSSGDFQWRSLRQRPAIELEIISSKASAWGIFKKHHYLDTNIATAARCFIALANGRPAAFASAISFPHQSHPGWREHRTVCLPDFQGVGIGNRLSDFVASLYAATGKPYRSTTGHPAMIASRMRNANWRMTQSPKLHAKSKTSKLLNKTIASRRLVASFLYIGPTNVEDALAFKVVKLGREPQIIQVGL